MSALFPDDADPVRSPPQNFYARYPHIHIYISSCCNALPIANPRLQRSIAVDSLDTSSLLLCKASKPGALRHTFHGRYLSKVRSISCHADAMKRDRTFFFRFLQFSQPRVLGTPTMAWWKGRTRAALHFSFCCRWKSIDSCSPKEVEMGFKLTALDKGILAGTSKFKRDVS